MMNPRSFLALFACGTLAVSALASSKFQVAHKFHLPGDERWDFLAVDEALGRVFASHGNVVQVADEKTGKLLGAISNLKGVHGIAFAPDVNKGYISDGKDTSVVIFDLKTLATLGKVKTTGNNPDAILYDPFSRRVIAFNGKSSNATVIDPATDRVAATIALDGKPEVAVSDGNGMIYVNLEDKNKVAAIDAKTMKVTRSWPLAPGESPSGLAIDTRLHRLFSVCENKLMVVTDVTNGKVIATVPIGAGVDGVGFDPSSRRAFSSNGEGTVTVVQESDGNAFQVLETVPTQKGAKTITVDTLTHHVFLSTAEFGPAPAPTPENPKARPPVKPDTFVILDLASFD